MKIDLDAQTKTVIFEGVELTVPYEVTAITTTDGCLLGWITPKWVNLEESDFIDAEEGMAEPKYEHLRCSCLYLGSVSEDPEHSIIALYPNNW